MAGRPVSIPESSWEDVRRWNKEGIGCRRIATMLEKHQVFTTRGSVYRLLRSLPPYDKGESLT